MHRSSLISSGNGSCTQSRQQDGINEAKAEGVRFGPKPLLTTEVVKKIKVLRADGAAVPEIMRRTKLSKASVYRALSACGSHLTHPGVLKI
jgi:DNA invertase Pin-like site-specific DNA recombinase